MKNDYTKPKPSGNFLRNRASWDRPFTKKFHMAKSLNPAKAPNVIPSALQDNETECKVSKF